MPSSHLPRTPCDIKFVYNFQCDFWGIVGGYIRATAYVYYEHRAISCTGPRGQAGVNPYRKCAEIVRKSCNVSAVAVQSPQPQPPHGNRTEPVRGSTFARCPCGDCAMPPTTCLRATGLRFFFFQICKTSR